MREHGRRRQSGVSTTSILLVLVLLALGALTAVEAYAGMASLLVPGSTWIPGDAVADAAPCPGERCDDVPFRPESALSFGQEVRNDGPMAVTVLGFPGIEDRFVRIESVEVARELGVASTEPADSVPFDTITLQPGEQRFLVFRGRFATCAKVTGTGHDTTTLLEAVPLRSRMLLVEHLQRVPLRRPLRFHGPTAEVC